MLNSRLLNRYGCSLRLISSFLKSRVPFSSRTSIMYFSLTIISSVQILILSISFHFCQFHLLFANRALKICYIHLILLVEYLFYVLTMQIKSCKRRASQFPVYNIFCKKILSFAYIIKSYEHLNFDESELLRPIAFAYRIRTQATPERLWEIQSLKFECWPIGYHSVFD